MQNALVAYVSQLRCKKLRSKTMYSILYLFSIDAFLSSLYFNRFIPFVKEIEKNHPYLSSRSLQDQIQENNVYIVDLTDISLKEPKIISSELK